MTLGWLLMVLFFGGLAVALAYGLARTRRVAHQPDHRARQDETTRKLYDDIANNRPPD